MANAKRCDRCKRYYDPLSIGDKIVCKIVNPIFQNAQDIRKKKITSYFLKDDFPDSYVDFCPECTTRFIKFMHLETDDSEDKTLADALIDKQDEQIKSLREQLDDAHAQCCILQNSVDFWTKCNSITSKELEKVKKEKAILEEKIANMN